MLHLQPKKVSVMTKYRFPGGGLSWLLVLASASVQAQTQIVDDDELAVAFGDAQTVSIATGSQKSLRLAPAVATVITAADIKAMGATDLDQVLESVPGLHVTRQAGTYTPNYLIRGIVADLNPQVLLLQNGIAMTTLFVGNKGQIWGGYPVQHIARIEIIRGPGSALYGADAFSGVINLITKTAADTQGTEVGVGAGSFGSREAWLQHGGKLGVIGVAGYVRWFTTDGSREIITSDIASGLDRAFGTRASLAPGPVNKNYDALDANLDLTYGAWRLRAGYKLCDDVGTGAGIAQALDPVGRAKSERITTDLSWDNKQFAPNWGVGANLSFMHYEQRIPVHLRLFPPGIRFPTGLFPDGVIGHPDTSERQWRLTGFVNYHGFQGHTIRVGLGHDDLNLYHTATFKNWIPNAAGTPVLQGPVANYSVISPFMLPQRRKLDYLYLQDEWQFAPDWNLTAGLRHDRYSDVGSTTNPRLALVWQASYNMVAKLLYGQAFRAPSFNETAGINNPTNRGNPNIRPETIKTLEVALGWQANKDTQFKLNLFRFSLKDIIRPVPGAVAGTGGTMQNVGTQTGKGLEAELAWQASSTLRVLGNYSYQRNIDLTTRADAGYAPHHDLFVRADWRLGRDWQISPQLNWVADRKRAFGDKRPPIADYKTLDLALRFGANKWQWSGTVRNVFNADAREPSLAPGSIANDLPLERRSVYLQGSYRF
jgi:outer membrane receptor protein involved in Fe transport